MSHCDYDDPLSRLCHVVRNNMLLVQYQRKFMLEAMKKELQLYQEVEDALAEYVAAERMQEG